MRTRREKAKSKKTGKEYELLVKEIYQAILSMRGDDFKNIKVQHNVRLQGITARKRQIDVYWEFELLGVTHRVCVQAKDMSRKISLPMIDAFRMVLLDIPGVPSGIMVTKVGYQKGVIETAKAADIKLMLLTDQTADSTLETITAKVHFRALRFLEMDFACDERWLKEMGIANLDFNGTPVKSDTPIYKADGSVLMTFGDTRKIFAAEKFRNLGEITSEIEFKQDAYFITGNELAPRLKVVGIRAKMQISEPREPAVISRHVAHLFQSIAGDCSYWVDNVGVVRKAGALLPIQETFEIEVDGQTVKMHLTIDEVALE